LWIKRSKKARACGARYSGTWCPAPMKVRNVRSGEDGPVAYVILYPAWILHTHTVKEAKRRAINSEHPARPGARAPPALVGGLVPARGRPGPPRLLDRVSQTVRERIGIEMRDAGVGRPTVQHQTVLQSQLLVHMLQVRHRAACTRKGKSPAPAAPFRPINSALRTTNTSSQTRCF
jgi:hypothetical protein